MKKFYLTILAIFISHVLSINAQQVNFNTQPVCFGEYSTLEAQYTNIPGTITGYYWDMNNNLNYKDQEDKIGSTVIYTFTAPDTFLVGLRIETTDSFYVMDAPKEVIVHPVPQVNFQVDNLCDGQLAVFTDQSTIEYGTLTNYYWDFDNDGNPDDITSGAEASINLGLGTHTVKLEVISDQNCSGFTTKTTRVYSMPIADFTFDDACMDEAVLFTNNSTIQNDAIDICVWNFGDGVQEASSGNISHTYSSAGTFSVSLVAISENNCRDTLENLSININPVPTLTLIYNETILSTGQEMEINAVGNYSSIEWSNGATVDSIIISDTGYYSVEVSNTFGCTSQDGVFIHGKTITPVDAEEIQIKSTIITPNGDGKNDFFIITDLNNYQNCKLSIYNIYGDLIEEINNYQNDWEGNELDPGSYFYIIEADGITKKGTINILQ
ncbi:MAG: gliding motility-associated C-terminal domain-containing protein [Bacteroidales bacterium]|nr:gliding motility-associated C-terminal domain-containing protein [Bacteroidales bacterium]